MKRKQENDNIKFNIGFLVPLLTFFAYIITYSYKVGYYDYFNLPHNLIQIDLINVLIVFGSLIIVYSLVIIITNLFSLFVKELHPYLKRCALSLFPFAIILIGSLYIHTRFERTDYILLSSIIVFSIFFLLFPLVTQRKIKGYYNKLDAQIQYENKYNNETEGIIIKTIVNLPKWILISIVILYFCSILANEAGRTEASKKIDYLYINDGQTDYAILEKIDTNYIIAQININNKTVKNNFKIINISDKNNEYYFKNIGSLKLEINNQK